jgi:hypothetical protein
VEYVLFVLRMDIMRERVEGGFEDIGIIMMMN